MTYHRLLAWSAWWMPLVEQDLILMGSMLFRFGFLMWTIVCLLFFLFLIFVFRYVGSGYTNVGFRLWLYLLGLKLSLYIVCILYFVDICIPITLHQSNQAHLRTWQAWIHCKYQIPSIFPCNLKTCTKHQNTNTKLKNTV